MNAIYKITIRTDQVDAEGKSAVRIRIRKAGQTRYLQTGIFLKYHRDKRKSEWNEAGEEGKNNWVTSRHFDYGALNDRLRKALKRLHRLEEEHPAFTATQLRDAYSQPEPEQRTGFIAFAREWIERKRKHGQYGSASAYVTQLGYFTRFWGKRPDEAHRLTPSVVSDFVRFLRTCDTRRGKGAGYEAKTINDAFSVYRSFFRHAVLEGWIAPLPNPFEIAPVEEGDKAIERPTVQQILSLMGLTDLSGAERDARNVFLMQFFCNGARVSEIYSLRWADVGPTHIRYKPKKKARSVKMVPRHEGIEWILEQYPKDGMYIFPYFAALGIDKVSGEAQYKRTQLINTQIANSLKRVARKAGLGHLSTHMQRHAFADYVWEKTKDIRMVQETIGHASSKTTEVYLTQLGQLQKDQLSRDLYEGVQGHVRETKINLDAHKGARGKPK